jgi:hypothetical protein
MVDTENPSFGFEYLASKVLFDPAFAQALLQDPAPALESIGIEPTQEILDALANVDVDSIVAVAEAFQTGPQVGQV